MNHNDTDDDDDDEKDSGRKWKEAPDKKWCDWYRDQKANVININYV